MMRVYLFVIIGLYLLYGEAKPFQLRGGVNLTETREPIDATPEQSRPVIVPAVTLTVLQRASQAAFKGGKYAATAGLVQVLSLMWLRTTVNYQYRYGVPMTTAIRQLYQQGGIARFYKGVFFALIIGPVSKFGAVAANEWSKILVESYYPINGASEFAATVLGTILTVLWRVFLMPIETCKTVLQVDGGSGFAKLLSSIQRGQIGVLYRGSTAAILSVAAGHYPWFMVYNLLDKYLSKAKREQVWQTVGRSAFIGFVASAVSDAVSNVLRVLKTVKQATGADGRRALSYLQIAQSIVNEGGLVTLFGRGLLTRIVTNGIQSVLFTVMWQVLPLWWAR